jgi:hypothetical protein
MYLEDLYHKTKNNLIEVLPLKSPTRLIFLHLAEKLRNYIFYLTGSTPRSK